MKKAIAITIKPQHLVNILDGTKLGEIRKNKVLINAIKREIAKKGKATIYCICSKKEWYLIRDNRCDDYYICHKNRLCEMDITDTILNGKVVCKFECKKVEEIYSDENGMSYYTDTITEDYKVSELARVGDGDIEEYLNGDIGYFIYISNLKVFKNSKKLTDLKIKSFEKVKVLGSPYGDLDSVAYHYEKKLIYKPLTKAPQNFCYVEDTL